MNGICHSYEIFFNGPFVYCGESKVGGGVRKRRWKKRRRNELANCEVVDANKLPMCGEI